MWWVKCKYLLYNWLFFPCFSEFNSCKGGDRWVSRHSAPLSALNYLDMELLPRELVTAPSCQSLRSIWTTLILMVCFFGWSYVEPTVGLDDPYGFLLTQDSLWFCELKFCLFYMNIWKVEVQNLVLYFLFQKANKLIPITKWDNLAYVEFKGKFHADFRRATISSIGSCSDVLYCSCLSMLFPFSVVHLILTVLAWGTTTASGSSRPHPPIVLFLPLGSRAPTLTAILHSATGWHLSPNLSGMRDLEKCIKIYKACAYCNNCKNIK